MARCVTWEYGSIFFYNVKDWRWGDVICWHFLLFVRLHAHNATLHIMWKYVLQTTLHNFPTTGFQNYFYVGVCFLYEVYWKDRSGRYIGDLIGIKWLIHLVDMRWCIFVVKMQSAQWTSWKSVFLVYILQTVLYKPITPRPRQLQLRNLFHSCARFFDLQKSPHSV